MNGKTPLAAIGQGLLAGVLGNAVFTGYQALQAKLASDDGSASSAPPKDWSEVPAPGQVGQRIAEGVFEQDVPLDKAGTVTKPCTGSTARAGARSMGFSRSRSTARSRAPSP